MLLSKEALEALAKIAKLQQELETHRRVLSNLLHRDTEGAFELCVPDSREQMFHNIYGKEGTKYGHDASLEILKDIADDGAVYVAWHDVDRTAYKFNIDRVNFIVLINKEVEANGNNI